MSDDKEGDYIIKLSEPEKKNSIICIELENRSARSINIGLLIKDENNYSVTRYYIPLMSWKNLVVFDSRGIVNSDSLINVSELCLRFFEKEDRSNVEVIIGNVYSFEQYDAMYKYINETDYIINPQ